MDVLGNRSTREQRRENGSTKETELLENGQGRYGQEVLETEVALVENESTREQEDCNEE